MNTISDEKHEEATNMFWDGHSVRDVSLKVGIARETAHRIQKDTRLYQIALRGFTTIRIGSAKFKVRDVEKRWFSRQYTDKEHFEDVYAMENNGKSYDYGE